MDHKANRIYIFSVSLFVMMVSSTMNLGVLLLDVISIREKAMKHGFPTQKDATNTLNVLEMPLIHVMIFQKAKT